MQERQELRLRQLRRSMGLSQAELADRSGVSKPTIGNLETGRQWPRRSTMSRLATALDVDVLELWEDRALSDQDDVFQQVDRIAAATREHTLADQRYIADRFTELRRAGLELKATTLTDRLVCQQAWGKASAERFAALAIPDSRITEAGIERA